VKIIDRQIGGGKRNGKGREENGKERKKRKDKRKREEGWREKKKDKKGSGRRRTGERWGLKSLEGKLRNGRSVQQRTCGLLAFRLNLSLTHVILSSIPDENTPKLSLFDHLFKFVVSYAHSFCP